MRASRGERIADRALLTYIAIRSCVLVGMLVFLVVAGLRNAVREFGISWVTLAAFVVAVVCSAAWYVAGAVQRRGWLS